MDIYCFILVSSSSVQASPCSFCCAVHFQISKVVHHFLGPWLSNLFCEPTSATMLFICTIMAQAYSCYGCRYAVAVDPVLGVCLVKLSSGGATLSLCSQLTTHVLRKTLKTHTHTNWCINSGNNTKFRDLIYLTSQLYCSVSATEIKCMNIWEYFSMCSTKSKPVEFQKGFPLLIGRAIFYFLFLYF
jgi:hypothetical protein